MTTDGTTRPTGRRTGTPFVLAHGPALPSPARVEPAERAPFRVGAVQLAYDADPVRHRDALADGVELAAQHGAAVVCLQELTLSPYFAITPDDPDAACRAEDIDNGPTITLARRLAAEHGVLVHASLYERSGTPGALGYNTAVLAGPDGELLARTRKTHIPASDGYHEDRYFAPGDSGLPVVEAVGARWGFPTCWDQWFPELARGYSLAGAEVLVYPTAIGSEPTRPGWDTQPLWQHMITANGLANATFMVAVNRIGTEGPVTFYGSSFVSDPYGRVLVQAPRDQPAVILADLDLDARRDWLWFGLLATRRPERYGFLLDSAQNS